MIAICPAGPPKLMKPSFSQKRNASRNGTGSLTTAGTDRIARQHFLKPAGTPATLRIAHERRGLAAIAAHHRMGLRTAGKRFRQRGAQFVRRQIAQRRHRKTNPRRRPAFSSSASRTCRPISWTSSGGRRSR